MGGYYAYVITINPICLGESPVVVEIEESGVIRPVARGCA